MALLARDTTMTGPFPAEAVVLLESLHGKEWLGSLFRFDITFLCSDPSLVDEDVMGETIAVGIRLDPVGHRYFHGVVTRFAKIGATQLHTRYAATLEPTLSKFGLTRDSRVFNDGGQDALGIVTQVLAGRGLTDVESGSISAHSFRARDFCVQYRESDLHFVQRLLEEEGLYYFFRHQETRHTLVLADSLAAHDAATGYETIPYTPKERQVIGGEEHLWGMTVRQGLYPGFHRILSGYDPTELRPQQARFGEAESVPAAPGSRFEHYDYPGGLYDPVDVEQEAILRREIEAAEDALIEVEGDTIGLGVGHLFAIRPGREDMEALPLWDHGDFDAQYLVVGATYSLTINQNESGNTAGADEPFRAHYWLLDTETPFRPRRTIAKPVLSGTQTALVVGPKDEEIWTDDLGRVRVQFDWDRVGQHDEKSTCWVRVSQLWAGAGWGGIHIPRIGHEVVVDFEDGDPDRPIIVGRAYNRDNMPPYDLPENRTQSGIKSRSSKGGTASNFNELRFEDKKGEEELHIQAEKDMSTLVKHDQSLEVGVDRDIVVGNDETTTIDGNRSTTVGTKVDENSDDVTIIGTHDKTVKGKVTQIYAKDHHREVHGNQDFDVAKNKKEHVAKAYTLITDQRFQLNQDATSMTFEATNVTLDSAGMITMKAGGAVVMVAKNGMVTINSPTGINLLCGGSGLSVLPGGIAIAAAAITAGAGGGGGGGGGSSMEIGDKQLTMKSKTVSIDADNICSVKGKSALKLNSP